MADEKITFTLADVAPGGAPLFTVPGGVGLYRKKAALDLTLNVGHGFTAQARLEDCFVRLGANDSFLEALLPGNPESEGFDIGFKWDSERGVSFGGGAALEVTLPLRARLPVVKLDALHLIAKPVVGADVQVPIELSVDATASLLGVIDASVQRIGVTATFYLAGAVPANAVAIGPFGATLKFKPPTGAGLSMNVAGVLNGGGFLSIDTEKGQYGGVLSLNVLGIGVTAIGIVNTKPKFSLVAIISANFKPVGIDISFGFTINAVGGIVGLHRSVDVAALAQGVRDNSIASIMFPADPVANAPRILSDLERIFPPVQNQFLVGPMIEMGWGKPAGMISISLGVIIELPEPKIVILGILKVLVPPLDIALLRIQVNFIGSIDFAAQFVRFDASLFDSKLSTYTLDGDMAARLRGGAHPNFVVTVGGFSPRFVPAADLEVGAMRRVSVNMLPTTDNPRLRFDSYYAVTSNTLQHGARIELYAAAAGFGIQGFLGYDLLAQMAPLHFEAGFGGAVSVLAFGEEILSLGLDLLLEGPSPWHVRGKVKFKLLFFKHEVGLDETFGNADAPGLPDVDLAAKFREQLNNPRNWSAALPAQGSLLVQLTPRLGVTDPAEILAHPAATLEFNERAMPLKVKLERFGAAKPTGAATFEITGMTANADLPIETLKSEFAPAQFFELTNDQKASAPAFQTFDSGVRANGLALVAFSKSAPRDFGYEDGWIDAATEISRARSRLVAYDVSAAYALESLGGSALAQSSVYKERAAALPTGLEIKLNPGAYQVVDAATLQPAALAGVHGSAVAAQQAMQSLVAASPGLAGRLQVVAQHELA